MLRFFALALCVSAVAGQINTGVDTLTTCTGGIGLSGYPNTLSSVAVDSITCADGGSFNSVGITANLNSGEDWNVILRPLGKGIVRQGFRLGSIQVTGNNAGISFCIMDTAPTAAASGTIQATLSCLGNTASSSGSPFIEDTTSNNIRHGWQFFNPTATASATAANTDTCAAYFVNGAAAANYVMGYVSHGGVPIVSIPTASCNGGTANTALTGETAVGRKYGAQTTGFLQLVNDITNANLNTGTAVTGYENPGVTGGMIHFAQGQSANAMGFQFGCSVNTVDETKWMGITFWAGNAPNVLTLANDPTGPMTTLIFRITCQNVATTTPTPPLYPTAGSSSALPTTPDAAPFPITAGAAGSVQLQLKSCTVDCISATKQARIISNTETLCLANNNVGCSVTVSCLISSRCLSVPSTTTLTSRRGLKQSQTYEQIVTVTSRDIRTLQYVSERVRNGALEGDVSAFSFILGYETSPSLVNTPFPVFSPSSATPNFASPSPNQPWTGITSVNAPCTPGSCTGSCNGGPITKVSNFASSTGAINCACADCNVPVARGLKQFTANSAYQFWSAICVNQATQSAANTCAANVAQDVVCWALNTPGVSQTDINNIQNGLWTYQAPSVGGGAPQTPVAAPTSCPTSSSSPKGLLGLLGLLALIPLLLCCCLLLLCLIRRKKREGDVHFATFDPQAANMGAPASIPAMGMSPCPAPMPIM